MDKIVMHIDANSAYLSWEATARLERGYPVDIREIPAAIAGDPKSRHGIILAKSIPTKKYGIQTGESLLEARQKCPELQVFAPNYDLYLLCSNAMYEILSEYSPQIERYSIDECFIDFTNSRMRFGDPVDVAHEIKERIKRELGFSVNVGVSSVKVLAKMGSELKKPDMVHTLWPNEIESKLWPLDVRELFMVGHATEQKLKKININTIGDLAKAEPAHMKALLKSHGLLVWAYANGIDDAEVIHNSNIVQKGVGNSTTIPYDVVTKEDAYKVLLALTERVGMRLRRLGYLTGLVSIGVKTDSFFYYSHQVKLPNHINTTDEIYEYACFLFDQCWKGEPVRHLGVSVTDFVADGCRQISMFDKKNIEKVQQLDQVVDQIRARYGTRSITRGTFANGDINPVQGGTNDSNYIMMKGYTQQ